MSDEDGESAITLILEVALGILLAYGVIKFFEQRAALRAQEKAERESEARQAREERLEERRNAPSMYLLKIWAEGSEHPDYEACQKDPQALLRAKFGLTRDEALRQVSHYYDILP